MENARHSVLLSQKDWNVKTLYKYSLPVHFLLIVAVGKQVICDLLVVRIIFFLLSVQNYLY